MAKEEEMDPVVHFEMPYENPKRMANFYTSAFGWQTKLLGKEMGNYVVASTTETDTRGPVRPGAINGGFYPRQKDLPDQCPSFVIAVDNLEASMKKVVDAGGKVLGEPTDIPDVGRYISFVDTEGNRASMLKAIPHNWHAPEEK
jgi:uncharacterized protein